MARNKLPRDENGKIIRNEENTEPIATPEPETVEPAAPVAVLTKPTRRIERRGGFTVPFVVKHPKVVCGVCEFCGILDRNVPSRFQYKLCQHYGPNGTVSRNLELACSYCDPSKDQEEVVGQHKLNIYDHPTDQTLVTVCSNTSCVEKHQRRFQVAG